VTHKNISQIGWYFYGSAARYRAMSMDYYWRTLYREGIMKTKQWVVGFLFRDERDVVLLMKTHPEWQAGKLNGIGGKVEESESTFDAMRREFLEETGAEVENWREFAILNVPAAGAIHFFVAHGSHEVRSMTEEVVQWYPIANLKHLPVIGNLHWLIPLALDPKSQLATTEYRR
jgi:8-oxo-dGTP diphosphatase